MVTWTLCELPIRTIFPNPSTPPLLTCTTTYEESMGDALETTNTLPETTDSRIAKAVRPGSYVTHDFINGVSS